MGKTCCCGCMNVAQGSLVIGILNIISSIFTIIQNSMSASTLLNSHGDVVPPQPPGGGGSGHPFTENKAFRLTMIFTGIFMAVAYLILSVMMIQGCRARQHRLIMPWLIWNYISLGLAAVATVTLFFVMAFNKLFLAGFILVIFMAILLVISAYFVRVVYYHVQELKGATY